jgi:hypothetical protein
MWQLPGVTKYSFAISRHEHVLSAFLTLPSTLHNLHVPRACLERYLMRLPGVGLRTVRALSQASTLRPQAPTFVPAGSHRNASVLNYTPSTFAFPPLLAANMTPQPPQPTLREMATRFQTQQDSQNAAEPELALYSYKNAVPIPSLYYVVNTDAADTLLSLTSIRGPLGFDLEWRPTFAKGVFVLIHTCITWC